MSWDLDRIHRERFGRIASEVRRANMSEKVAKIFSDLGLPEPDHTDPGFHWAYITSDDIAEAVRVVITEEGPALETGYAGLGMVTIDEVRKSDDSIRELGREVQAVLAKNKLTREVYPTK